MKTYTVKVNKYGNIFWYKENTLIRHCEHGPAITTMHDSKDWYLDNEYYDEEDFNKEMKRRNNPCKGKIVEIDGKKYKLTEV